MTAICERFRTRCCGDPAHRLAARAAGCRALITIGLALLVSPTAATPPEYKSFKRDQVVDYDPDPGRLLRIWVVFVDQGDGILIQLPPDASPGSERLDVLVDGGPQGRMLRFLQEMYPDEEEAIEAVILTHHDADHVAGITKLLAESSFRCGPIFHNGLASYRAGRRGFVPGIASSAAIFEDDKDGVIKRGLAFLEPSGRTLKDEFLVPDLPTLQTAFDDEDFTGIYHDFAEAVCGLPPERRLDGYAFLRAHTEADFVELEQPAGADASRVEFELLWPPADLDKFVGWSKTLNGNSVTFRLRYGEFQMLFTGDHHELSQPAMWDRHEPDQSVFACDVLKVPHHGSRHSDEEFLRNVKPVLSVASMGNKGFGTSWKHPSPDVIQWLGGPHRVYHTFIHERRFQIEDLKNAAERKKLIEKTHILIETDGVRFRLVEIVAEGDDQGDLHSPPTVRQTGRSHGTRWICAKDQGNCPE